MAIRDDTSDDARRVLLAAIRAQTPARKFQILDQEFALARSLMKAGIRLRRPAASPEETHAELLRLLLGHDDAERALAHGRSRGERSAERPQQHGPAAG